MRRRDFNALSVGGLFSCAAAQAVRARESTTLTPDRYFDRLETFGFSGGAFVVEDGGTVWSRAVGWADKTGLVRFSDHTLFNIASVTKPITALTVLALVAEGKISLGDPLGRFIPGAPDDKATITIGELLSHTAGLRREVRRPRGPLQRDAMLAPILASELAAPRGERFSYSNEGYRLLAAVIEIADGRSYRDAVRARILEPAGMTETGFVQDYRSDLTIAQGYSAWGGLGDFRTQRAGWNEGAGNLVSTLGDMQRFVVGLSAGRIIPVDLLNQAVSMHSPNAGETSYEGYGYGWFLTTLMNGSKLAFHGGDNTGYHSELRCYPAAHRWIFVTTTREAYDDSGTGLGLHVPRIAANLSRLRQDEPFDFPPDGVPVPRSQDARLTGDFVTSDGVLRLVRIHPADPHLTAVAIGQAAANALRGVAAEDAAELDQATSETLRIARMIVGEDVSGLNATPLLSFFADGWLTSFEHWRTELGPWLGFGPITSGVTPVGEKQIRTHLPFRFERGERVQEFTWNDGRLYETLTGTGSPSSVMLPVAHLAGHTFSTWDIVTNARTTMSVVQGRLTTGAKTFHRA